MSARAAARLLVGFAGVFALGYLVTLPPFGWGDEVPHFVRAYRVSRGQPIATTDEGRRGSLVPGGLQRFARASGLTAVAWDECTLRPGQLAPLFAIQAGTENEFSQEYGAPYPPLASVHTALAVRLARSLTDRPVFWFYGARLANLSAWLALSLWALYLVPRLRMTLLAILVTPTALFLAATCSVDGLLDAVAFLWAAYVLRLASEGPVRPDRRTIAVVLAFALLLGVIKLVYAPLVLMLLLVPAAEGRASWRAWSRLAVAGTVVGASSAVIWIALAGGGATDAVVFGAREGHVYDPLRVVRDPAGTVLALLRTIRAEWYPWLVNVAWPKYTRCMALHSTAVPIVWGSILLALVADGSGWRPTLLQRLVGAGVFAAVLSVSLLVALATWTPVDMDRAIGVHARYFLPALPGLAVAVLPPITRLGDRAGSALRGAAILGLLLANALVLVAFLRQYDWSSSS